MSQEMRVGFFVSTKEETQKEKITMATLTKKDLLEAIEDMPMDAKIEFYHYNVGYANIYKAYYNEELNRIELC